MSLVLNSLLFYYHFDGLVAGLACRVSACETCDIYAGRKVCLDLACIAVSVESAEQSYLCSGHAEHTDCQIFRALGCGICEISVAVCQGHSLQCRRSLYAGEYSGFSEFHVICLKRIESGKTYIRRAARGIDIISVCSAGRILHVIERCRFLDFRI